MEQKITFDTVEQQQALDLVTKTNVSFFLTGKAGTGKTTFIRYIKENVNKHFLVIAPTGVAAIQAGGQTVHKTFGFPWEALSPKASLNFNPRKVAALRDIDTIIIDECSMLRADYVDGIDRYLRIAFNTNMPFAGKQIIFVGDLFQLPPIVKKDSAEAEMLLDIYGPGVPFFYKANVLKHMNLPKIQFNQVYRQKDTAFVNALNNIRVGKATAEDLALLNEHVCSDDTEKDYVVTLSAYNNMAEMINNKKLAELDTTEFVYKGETKGEFEPSGKIVPDELHLKVGAQVIFCRNDRNGRYINGTIGKVAELKEDEVVVTLENGTKIDVDKAVWENKKSVYNRVAKKTESEVIGQYIQYPVKLAWAITIHKSQGMTFDKMRIDLTRGVFEAGQIYVALSRVRSLDGLSVNNKVMPHHVRQNAEVTVFASSFNDEHFINDEIESGEAMYPYVSDGDYDKAAMNCMKLVKAKMAANDLRNAAILAKRMYDIMLTDKILMSSTKYMPLLKDTSMTGNFLNAMLCLYGERYEEAIVLADLVLNRRACHEAMYIKSKALMMLGKYEEADMVNQQYIDDEKKNGDSIVDKKWHLLIAETNSHVGDPVINCCQNVIKECPKYYEAYLLIRKDMQERGDVITVADEDESNELIEMFNNKDVENDKLLDVLNGYDTDSKEIKGLRTKLLHLKE